MKKTNLIVVVLAVFLVAVGFYVGMSWDTSSEQLESGAKLVTTKESQLGEDCEKVDIVYGENGEEFQSYFDPEFRDALEWINENIEDVVFLSWWDYGHMIRGYTGNKAVIYSPSEDILWSLASGKWDEEGSGKFSSREDVNDVAVALTSLNPDETREVMQRHGADYVFVTTRDIASSFILFRIAGLEDFLDGEYEVNDKAKDTVLFKMINDEPVEGFELVYSDDLVRIFKMIG